MNLFNTALLVLGANIVTVLAVLVCHECGHVFAAGCAGVKVKKVGFSSKGPYIVRESGTWTQNLLVTFAGPVASLLMAALFWTSLHSFAWWNLMLGVSQFLPLPGSDGMRVFRLLASAATR